MIINGLEIVISFVGILYHNFNFTLLIIILREIKTLQANYRCYLLKSVFKKKYKNNIRLQHLFII